MRSINFFYHEKINLNNLLKENNIFNSDAILIQIFTAICEKKFIENLIEKLNTILPNATIIGSTTDGEILGGSAYTGTTVLSFCIFEKTKIEHFSIESKSSNLTSFEVGEILARKLIKNDTKAIIAFADGINTNGEDFLKGIEKTNPKVTVAGGLAGDNATFSGTFVFTNTHIYEDGVVAVALNSNELNVFTDYSFGWLPIGKKLTITKAIKNRVYTIDDLSAVDIYTKYLGEDLSNKLPAIGIEFPLLIKRGNYKIARAALKVHSDKSITFAGNFQNGDSVYFGLGNVENIINKSKDVYKNLYNLPIESMFIYSCMARRRFLQDSVSVELHSLNSIVPISGFFTYGEFYHSKTDKNKLFNETMTILALSENRSIDNHNNINIDIEDVSSSDLDTLKALTHLTNAMSVELNELNQKLHENTTMLIRQSRQAAMGEMIGNIAHQWRQPLNAVGIIIQKVELTYRKNKLNAEIMKTSTSKAMGLINKMSTTIDDFRNFFKPNKKKSIFHINQSIKEAITLMSATLENHKIKLIYDSKDFEYYGFANEFSQVVLNIINNSKDAIIDNKVENGEITINSYQDELNIIIEIKDNGGGIKEHIIGNIFEPYFTTKEEGKGTGIGLYMSKMIIEQNMGGKLNAKNHNSGVKFIIKLPIKKFL